ncbi:MAG: oxygen-independent coproporphyrinogen III oxidase [Hyphomonadaceae bacterium]|nr:oxygen-independent coproporphyrinogen III oxidase [Clostridia bacterium]
MKPLSIYVHVPFCQQKCLYCDFTSYVTDEQTKVNYMQALFAEIDSIKNQAQGYQVQTVFIGGGTPTCLSPQWLERLFEQIHVNFNIAPNAEITVEANPGTLNETMLTTLKSVGVNRLSIGLQAWQDKHLKVLGRLHTRQEFIENFALARQLGFQNLSVDLMFALPDQTFQEWEQTIHAVCQLAPEHLSCYALKVEEGTPFDSMQLNLPNEDTDRAMYHRAIEILEQNGYQQYEISNFAKKGFASQHNLTYWQCGEYIGLGAAAHSYFQNERYAHTSVLADYIKQPSEKIDCQTLTPEEKEKEFIILGLRLNKGIDLDAYQTLFKKPFDLTRVQRMIDGQLMYMQDNHLKLTIKGMDISNQIFMQFI